MKKKDWIIIGFLIGIVIIVILLFEIKKPKIEVYTDIERYELKLQKENTKWHKWGMKETIWPEMITSNMNVKDYKMVYYDPFDAQYLGYLEVEYSDNDYQRERARLINYESTEYIGYYNVREEETYTLLAINADPYYGFVYALTDGNNKIIYAEQIFCNYFMDLNYKEYMRGDYFLDGFDATKNNPYRKKKFGK